MTKAMYKALIVDDERPARQVIMALGDWHGYGIEKPLEAGDGSTALKLIGQMKPDIVFVDIGMPCMDGLSLMEQASHIQPETIFIVISGYDDFEYARRSIRYNVVEYLLKPVIEAELNGAISRAVEALRLQKQAAPAEKKLDAEPGAQRAPISKDDMVNEIKRFIDERYMEDIALQQFAAKYYVTKEHLSRCFKKAFGYGVYEYVTFVRMEHAKELLKTGLKINAVAHKLGYQDHHYFSRVFFRYFGCYPTHYRIMH